MGLPPHRILTQCLQRDFVGAVPPHEPLPNRLHVGHAEALRLLGREPEHGPVAQLIRWARERGQNEIQILHIRDWHERGDPRQHDHLDHFGDHCLQGTNGAKLVLDLDSTVLERANEHYVDAPTLNDFEGTDLLQRLEALRARASDGLLRVGVIGVWTEAKVSFLMYELRTRCRVAELATCSALTASSSRTQHFNALGQMASILDVSVFNSVGEFTGWLVPDSGVPALPRPSRGFGPVLTVMSGGELSGDDTALVGHLFREARAVDLDVLAGGFSGAAVFAATSRDALGHDLAPAVLKLGSRKLIGAERVAFERVEAVLGNDAPRVLGFAEQGERAGIKYAYAAMGRGGVRTFKKLYAQGASESEVGDLLDAVFGDILDRFYRVARYERLPLLEHYGFSDRWAHGIAEQVAGLGFDPDAPRLSFPGGYEADNLVGFYRDFLADPPREGNEYHYVSYVHGDLNGANILVDPRRNVWIIDFFHTARAHVLKDLAKLKNDLLFIFTPLTDVEELAEALLITKALRAVVDLRAELPEELTGLTTPALLRCWSTVRALRGHVARLCREDRLPRQMATARLRYAAQTMGFEESDTLQRRWALAAACGYAEDIVKGLSHNAALRVDWLPAALLPLPGRCGMTLCPGRRDRGRDVSEDIALLKAQGVARLVALLTQAELDWAGVPDLASRARAAGLGFQHLPIRDQAVPTIAEADAVLDEVDAALRRGEDVVLHCMAGIGRAGTLAACLLTRHGLAPDDAIAVVRETRDPRSLETSAQVAFLHAYAERGGVGATASCHPS